MSRTAQPFARHLSIMLASTAMMVGYSQMTTATAQPIVPPPATALADKNPMLAPWTGPYEGVPPWDKMDPELFPDVPPVFLSVRLVVQVLLLALIWWCTRMPKRATA